MKTAIQVVTLALWLLSCPAGMFAQAPGADQQQPEFVRQARQLLREGRLEAALAVYQQELKTSPDSAAANIGAGSVLDLLGRGEEARKHFSRAIDIAKTPDARASAQRAMAMSWAFEGNCAKTMEYEKQVFDFAGEKKDFFRQGEIANEGARVCLETGDLDAAAKWYKTGYETGLKEPNIASARRDLWEFRWEHAQARLAARRGDKAEAQKHVAAAKAILDKGTNPEQKQYFPYLKGYVELYTGDYRSALEDLKQANQEDAFIQALLAQTYEKLGEKTQAVEHYQKAAKATSHNPPAAYAVPLARKKLQ